MNFYTVEKIPEMAGGQLFNDPMFHIMKAATPRVFVLKDSNEVLGRIIFYHLDSKAISGYKAPFGSFDLVKTPIDDGLTSWLKEIMAELKREGIEEVVIVAPPDYFNYTTEVEKLLLKAGFAVVVEDINQQIIVERKAYARCITQKERNKLNRAEAEGYQFLMMTKEQIPEAFRLISEAYQRKNFPVTLSEKELFGAFNQMPERYFMFGLYDEDDLIAVVASVKVNNEVLYNFYHADHQDYRTRSPLVMLIGEVYKFCQQEDIKFLDLGISSVDGIKNEGLFRFKENLGSKVSLKKTFRFSYA